MFMLFWQTALDNVADVNLKGETCEAARGNREEGYSASLHKKRDGIGSACRKRHGKKEGR